MKSSTIRTILGLSIILLGIFLPQIQERIPDLVPDTKPAIEIVEPSQEIKDKGYWAIVLMFNSLMTCIPRLERYYSKNPSRVNTTDMGLV